MSRPVFDAIVTDAMKGSALITEPLRTHKYLFQNRSIDTRSLPIRTLIGNMRRSIAFTIHENQY